MLRGQTQRLLTLVIVAADIAVGGKENDLKVWDLESGKATFKVSPRGLFLTRVRTNTHS